MVVSSDPDNELQSREDADESAEENHAHDGVYTCPDIGIHEENDVVSAFGVKAGVPAVLLGAYQGASQAVFQPPHMGHPVTYSGLNCQTHMVDSSYHLCGSNIMGMPNSVPVIVYWLYHR